MPKKDYVTAFHGTSASIVKIAKEKNLIRGWFDTTKETCFEYAERRAEQDRSQPVVVEVYLSKKRFARSWLSQIQMMMGKGPFTSDLRLSWNKYVVAVWHIRGGKWSRTNVRDRK